MSEGTKRGTPTDIGVPAVQPVTEGERRAAANPRPTNDATLIRPSSGEVFIDVREPIEEMCRRLGLTPSDVGELKCEPTRVTAVVYRLNQNGMKYVDENSELVSVTLVFPVQT